MGQEIATCVFTKDDFESFRRKLAEETSLLKQKFDDSDFSGDHGVGGFELEAWLVDRDMRPAPINERYLRELGDPMVCAELALFNIELNSAPRRLEKDALSLKHQDLERSLASCLAKAGEMDASVMLIGILPTVSNGDLAPENMSKMKRYRALNDQVVAFRRGNPFKIEIEGRDRLRIEHESVMLEAATTALQIQFQVDFKSSLRFYNAGLVLAAPMVAASANSPYLFGRSLWDETRIPLFEQSLGGVKDGAEPRLGPNRVTLGRGFAKESLYEIFHENMESYHALLPMVFDGEPAESFCHLRLHNGAIWRWNRPLVGISEDGSHHIRIEHRVAPSGPTAVDIIANAALFFGAVETMGRAEEPPESRISFERARDNFYAAARDGLRAKVKWTNGEVTDARTLLLDEVIPLARQGLVRLGLDRDETNHYMDIIERRVRTGRNGAGWQRSYVKKHGCDMAELCAAYLERQTQGAPVSEWSL